MAEKISEVEMLLKKGDAAINVEPPPTISSKKNCCDLAGPSKKSNIDGVTTQDPVQALVQKLKALPGQPHDSRTATIFRIPSYSSVLKTKIKPEMVSIGPYHHGKGSLRPMENHKVWYLRDFLARKPAISMEAYLQEMREMEPQARRCYDDVISMSTDEFSLMLLLDGCFILEYFLKVEDSEIDNIVDVGWSSIELDFMKIENQIPYSIIHKLASIHYYGADQNCEDHECFILSFIYKRLMYKYEFVVTKPNFYCGKIHHLLHLYQLCMKPPSKPDQTNNSEGNQSSSIKTKSCLSWLWPQSLSLKARSCLSKLWPQTHSIKIQSCLSRLWPQTLSVKARSCLSQLWPHSFSIKAQSCFSWLQSKQGLEQKEPEILYRIPSATKLSEAGVTFKQKIDPRDRFDITFKDGVMEIPFVSINVGIKTLFTNVLLYEQAQNFRTPKNFTSFLLIMDHLVDTSDDVALLVHAGIIGNFLQDDEEVAIFFNQMADFTMIDFHKSYYIDLVKEVVNYINLPWHSYRAMLVRNYFGNPWSIISVVAAVILLLFTVMQTGFTIYPVVHQK